ncbi:MAG TPA: hypothetical protein VGA13_08130 [Acidimicrobiales bacterium]
MTTRTHSHQRPLLLVDIDDQWHRIDDVTISRGQAELARARATLQRARTIQAGDRRRRAARWADQEVRLRSDAA